MELLENINELSRLREEIVEHLRQDGAEEIVSSKYVFYKNLWRRFVKLYESHLETLDPDCEDSIQMNYEEQKTIHNEFSSFMETGRRAYKSRTTRSLKSTRRTSVASSSTIRSRSTHSSRLSGLARKKEELALAELSIQQIQRQQEIARKISDLEQQQQLLAAEMTAERARASLRIYEEENDDDDDSNVAIGYDDENKDIDAKISLNPFVSKQQLFSPSYFILPQGAQSTPITSGRVVNETEFTQEVQRIPCKLRPIHNNNDKDPQGNVPQQDITYNVETPKQYVKSNLPGFQQKVVVSSAQQQTLQTSALETVVSHHRPLNVLHHLQTNNSVGGPQGNQPTSILHQPTVKYPVRGPQGTQQTSVLDQPTVNYPVGGTQGTQPTSVLHQPSVNYPLGGPQGTQPTSVLDQPTVNYPVGGTQGTQPTSVLHQPSVNYPLGGPQGTQPTSVLHQPTVNYPVGGTQGTQAAAPVCQFHQTESSVVHSNVNTGEEIVKALRQVVNTPKVEYMHFDGDPLKYISFMHNFESCLERDNPDYSSKLQLLIQHCTGKAREAIESCVNLPPSEGYNTAKNTLKENFGQAHVIAQVHVKRLENLPVIKIADGPTLLSFARKLEETERTLRGMGQEYMTDIDHVNTLKELHRKLPMFLRAKWTEIAGKMIAAGRRPKFVDFLKFVKERAALVNNEFGEDMKATTTSKEKFRGKERSHAGGSVYRATTLATSLNDPQPKVHVQEQSRGKCIVCSENHKLWKCDMFKKLSYKQKKEVVRKHRLCMRCLCEGHFIAACTFQYKCRETGCKGDHHMLLHPPSEGLTGISQTEKQSSDFKPRVDAKSNMSKATINAPKSTGGSQCGVTGAGNLKVCLGIIPIKVKAKGSDTYIKSYALLDSGSEITLCHEDLINELELQGTDVRFTLTGMTGTSDKERKEVDIIVSSMDDATTIELFDVKTVKEMPISKSCIATREDLQKWSHLKDIDLEEIDNKEVMLLIGVKDQPSLFIPLEYRQRGECEPVAIRYSLGWAVIGPVGGRKENTKNTVNWLHTANCTKERSNVSFQNLGDVKKVNPVKVRFDTDEETQRQIDNEHLEQQLERLWKTDFGDSVVNNKVAPSIEDRRALEMMEASLTKVGVHYQVGLPWKDEEALLPNNKDMAERRCELLRKRLLRDKDLFEKYKTAMHDYIDKGHAVKVPEDEMIVKDRPVWYLPHHPVVHPLKPDKVRIVFDCAAKAKGTSLNKELLQGPDLTNQLMGVLSRFRQESIGVVADVEGMFLQVFVEPKDCDALRFLWWRHDDLSNELEEYRMIKHLFGASSSPSVANFCLRKTADAEQKDFSPEVADTVKRNMYVDDLMKSTATSEEAIMLVSQLRELLSRGGFRLTKWYSNDRDVLASIPESERAKSVVSLELESLPTESALGLKWNIEEDKFVWEVLDKVLHLVKQKPVTRRGILSVTYSLFDPLSFIAPFIMKAKLLLQMLSRKGLGWDDTLDDEERSQWIRWIEDIPKLEDIKLERCFKPTGFGRVKETQLHLFSDAPRVGYAAVAFLRFVNDNNQIHCAFVMGKARLAPLREISIPRLELTAAVISVKLSKALHEELDLTIDRNFYWTDSTSVLKCIHNTSKRFHTFESNRLTIILDVSKPSEWRYVNREDNPADDGSKGLKLADAIKDDRWLRGPPFLWQDETAWPEMISIPVMKDDDVEVRKEIKIYATSASEDVLDRLMGYYSSWLRLRSSVAWLVRFKQYLLVKSRNKSNDESLKSQLAPLTLKHLTVQELQEAEKVILRRVQKVSFPEVVKLLSSDKCKDERTRKTVLKKVGTSIHQLNPVWDQEEGMMRVGGRLTEAPISEASKHPILLPYKHRVTDLIIEYYHVRVGHMGQESVLSSLREKFWIVKGRSAVRSVVHKCISCQKRSRKPAEQFMANLPKERVTPNKPPFTFVGIDYFGPFEVKQRRSRVKRYGCLFTCLTTRAVHIEVAHSLDTDSLINALRRFISLRGHPEQIRSDRGTNLTKACKDLKEALKEVNEDKVYRFCLQKEIQWVFNPPSASHMGGAWERMIRTVRQVLKSLLKEQLVNDEVLLTVMAEVSNIINSRPLTRNSDDPTDDEPLTPNHLLQLRHCPSLPPGIFDKDDSDCKRAWRQAQYISNVFWKRWVKQYLPTLLERKKWNLAHKNFKVGDLALLVDANYPRGKWPLARVVEVNKGRDDYVRTVRVRVCSTVATNAKRKRTGGSVSSSRSPVTLTRPVTKLCRLELEGESEDV